ncbi:MAG: 23S rRNA pseudouridine2457 synthase [Pseudohongiellaceae bacterium]|jgi:23S rRNA pseudouridine2457 synthase
MSQLLLFNKPFGVLSQFTGDDPEATLSHFIKTPGLYAAGRLDKDSEGLLLLTDDGKLQARIADPKYKQEKTYWVQVEGEVSKEALVRLRGGVNLRDGKTLPATANVIDEPKLWQRTPPIRERLNIPTTWLELKIKEGKNRQVRRMTAAVGNPTLRLVRCAIGVWSLKDLLPGESTTAPVAASDFNP